MLSGSAASMVQAPHTCASYFRVYTRVEAVDAPF